MAGYQEGEQRFYPFYIKGFFPIIGWRKLYAGDDGKLAQRIYSREVQRRTASGLKAIVSYQRGAIWVSKTRSFDEGVEV